MEKIQWQLLLQGVGTEHSPFNAQGHAGPWAPCRALTEPERAAFVHLGDGATRWSLRSFSTLVFTILKELLSSVVELLVRARWTFFPAWKKKEFAHENISCDRECLRDYVSACLAHNWVWVLLIISLPQACEGFQVIYHFCPFFSLWWWRCPASLHGEEPGWVYGI